LFADADAAQRTRAQMDAHGVRCACYSVSINILSDVLGPAQNLSGVEVLKKSADYAKILGSPFLHHTLTIGYEPPRGEVQTLADLLPALLERAGQVAAYANSIGLTVLYEPQGFYVNGLDGFSVFYEAMKARGYRVGVCGDTGNSLYVGCDPAAFFERYAAEILHVHLKDLHIENKVLNRTSTTASRRWDVIRDGRYITDTLLGEGMVDLDACLRALDRVGYAGAYSLETFYWNNLSVSLRENLLRDREYLLRKGE
jgi:sugar phosphate isomerase/epimerase